FEFPTAAGLIYFFFCEQGLNPGFNVFGASRHPFGGFVSEKAFCKFIATIRFATFFHHSQTTDMSGSALELRKFSLLVLVGLELFIKFKVFLVEIIAVIAVIRFDGMGA